MHSPVVRGFLYAHVGWIFVPRNTATDYDAVRDLTPLQGADVARSAPLFAGASCSALASWVIAGWPGLVVGFCWSTVVLWHATFSINSLAHLVGRRRYVTGDQSRNNWLLALLTMGEGWHNNHHAYQASVRQGFRWWECDVTYYVLRGLSWVGLVWDLHVPPQAVIRGEQRLGTLVIDKVAGQLAALVPGEIHREPGAGDHGAPARLDRAAIAPAVRQRSGGGVLERDRVCRTCRHWTRCAATPGHASRRPRRWMRLRCPRGDACWSWSIRA